MSQHLGNECIVIMSCVFPKLFYVTCESEETLWSALALLPAVQQEGQLTRGPAFSPHRDAVVGALMPASMIAPVECPSFPSSAPPSDASAAASPMNGEECVLAADIEDRLSPSPWQEKRGEVR